MSLREGVDALKERQKCREPVERMLELIAEIANYICNIASSSAKGAICFCCPHFFADDCEDTFVTHKYQRRVDDFKNRFKKARQNFSDNLQVEMIKGVHWLGGQSGR